MSCHPLELRGLQVSVDDVLYMPSLEAPDDRPHPFVYFLTIRNDAEERVQILARKWVVEGFGGETQVVEGDGVVGKCPRLSPGEQFSYNSYHVVDRNSRVGGAFFGRTDGGELVCVRIPEFELQIPQWA